MRERMLISVKCPYCGCEFRQHIMPVEPGTTDKHILTCETDEAVACGKDFVVAVTSPHPVVQSLKIEGEET